MEYKKILGSGLLVLFLLSLLAVPVMAKYGNGDNGNGNNGNGNVKSNAELAQARLTELKHGNGYQYGKYKSAAEKGLYKHKLVDINNEIEVYADLDASTIISKKGKDGKIKLKDIGDEHKLRSVKLKYSDVAGVPGFDSGNVLISHYDDLGFRDAQWVQHVSNEGGFVYLDDLPFSEIVIGGFVGKYIISGKMVYQNSNIFGLGSTFEPDNINYISATVEPDVLKFGPYDIPTDGLISWWPFDANCSDVVGTHHWTNPVGSVSYSDMRYNTGVVFDVDGAMRTSSYQLNDSMSFCGVINTSNSTAYIIGQTGGSTSRSFIVKLSSGRLGIDLANGTDSTYVISSMYINDNKQHFIGVSIDHYDVVFCVDGVFQSFTAPLTFKTTTTDQFYIGGFFSGSYAGGNDNFLIYNRSLSEDEMKQICYDSLDNLTLKSNSIPSAPTTGGTVSVPYSAAGADITTLTTSVPTNTTIDNVTVRYYNETVTPFNITTEIGYTENTTIITEELTDEYYRVYITHIPGCDYENGYVNYTSDPNDILDSPFVHSSLDSNNDNATHTLSTHDWSVTTGPINAGQTYNYVLTAYLEGTEIDDIDRDGIGYTGLGAYEAEGNETTIIGSRFIAYSSKETEWGGNGSDIYIPVAGIILVSVIIIAVGFAIKGLNGIKED